MGAVTLVNCFLVPAGREEEFFALWKQVNVYMQAKRGYVGHTLYRAVAPGAAFQFVNVARWQSAEDFNAAHDEGFRALLAQPAWQAFRSQPSLCKPFDRGGAG